MNLQLKTLFPRFDSLQAKFGDPKLKPIYGAGCVKNPKLFLIFMNPTGRNVSANPTWKGLRAPWIGTKNIWKLLFGSRLLSKQFYDTTQSFKPSEWTPEYAKRLYVQLAQQKLYITNFAKCTQLGARPLKNKVFNAYRELLLKEIQLVRPKKIVAFGNLVSSLLLQKPIMVSSFSGNKHETLTAEGRQYSIYPTFYPVGQGLRNIAKSISRIKSIMRS